MCALTSTPCAQAAAVARRAADEVDRMRAVFEKKGLLEKVDDLQVCYPNSILSA